jgi:hypothetical protein
VSPIESLLALIQSNGLEAIKSFYSIYRSTVKNNADPEKRGRIQAQVHDLGQTAELDRWIDPLFDYAGKGVGMFFPPEIGSPVRVFFNLGDPSIPIGYFGGWYTEGALPKALGYDTGGSAQKGTAPIKRGIVTKAGHTLVFNDKAGSETLRLLWNQPGTSKSAFLSFEPDGSLDIRNANGTLLHLDATGKSFKVIDENGNSVTLDSEGAKIVDKKGNFITIVDGTITLSASGDVILTGKSVNLNTGGVFLAGSTDNALLGKQVIQYLATHQHPTGVGPSGPPIVPPTPALLSQKVKLG